MTVLPRVGMIAGRMWRWESMASVAGDSQRRHKSEHDAKDSQPRELRSDMPGEDFGEPRFARGCHFTNCTITADRDEVTVGSCLR